MDLEERGQRFNGKIDDQITADGGWVRNATEVLAGGELPSFNIDKLRYIVSVVEERSAKANISCPEIMLNDKSTTAGYNRIWLGIHDLEELSKKRLEFVAEHELAHVIRNDWQHYGRGSRDERHEIEHAANDLAMDLHGGPDPLLRYYRSGVKHVMGQAEAASITPDSRQQNLRRARQILDTADEWHSSWFDRIRRAKQKIKQEGWIK